MFLHERKGNDIIAIMVFSLLAVMFAVIFITRLPGRVEAGSDAVQQYFEQAPFSRTAIKTDGFPPSVLAQRTAG